MPSQPGLLNRSQDYLKLKACCLTTTLKRCGICVLSLAHLIKQTSWKLNTRYSLTQMNRNLKPTFTIPKGPYMQAGLTDKFDSRNAYTWDTSGKLYHNLQHCAKPMCNVRGWVVSTATVIDAPFCHPNNDNVQSSRPSGISKNHIRERLKSVCDSKSQFLL